MQRIARQLSLALVALASSMSAQTVGIGFNGTGLGSVTFNGFEFLDYGDLRLHSVIFANGSTGSTAGTVTVNAGAQTQTRTYSWGTIVVNYAAVGNRLNLTVTVNNQTASAIRQIWFEPMGVRFPSNPSEFDLGFPLLRASIGQVAAQSMTYTGGAMALISDDITKPVLIGYPYSNNQPFNTRFPITLNTDRVDSYASVYPTINRPIPAFGSDQFRFSLRFGGTGSTLASLGADAFQNFALAFPSIFNWTDRRPIAQLVLSASNLFIAKNPRGWLFDSTIDVTTPAGLAIFRQKILNFATMSVPVIQSMNGQGAITWDIEGQEFPHPFSYIGDPRLLNSMAPEMGAVADEFFAIFRNAGLRVGVCLRPQQFSLSPLQQNSLSDPAVLLQMMVDKVNYARNRWNTTLFYIDSNVNATDPNPLDVSLFRSLATMFPDTLFITEHSYMQYFASVAGYKELAQGFTSTTPEVRTAYPNAATFIYTPNADPAPYITKLTTAFQQGDSFLFRGWYVDQANDLLRDAFQTAHPGVAVSVSPHIWSLTPGGTQQFTASVTGSAGTGVSWRVVPDGIGTVSPSGLYTAPASINARTNVIVQAVSAADPSKSGIASVSIVQGVAISLSPSAVSLSANQTQQFTATVTGSPNTNVTWELAGAGTLSASGLYTAPPNITSAQTVTVTATSVADSQKSAASSITLNPGVSVNVSVTPPAVTLTSNQTQQFTATVVGSANTAVTWSLAGAGTLSSSGLYTAPASISPGQTATVTATSVADGTKSASALVTLSPTVTISVTPPTVTLSANQTQQFTAIVTGTPDTSVTWTLTGPGTLSTSGLYTAPASISPGQSATVRATSVADISKAANGSVTLSPSVAVSVAPPTVTLTANQTQQFTPTVTGSANTNVTWTLTGAGTLSTSGLYTAPASIAGTQTVTVTATSVADATKFANATVTLSPTVAVSIAPLTATLTASQTQQFTPTVTGSANTNVTWTLTGAGTLSSTGLYTAPVAIAGTQTVTVTATSVADSTKFASASVTLSPTVAVSIAPLTATLTAGQTQQFTPTVTGSANTNVTWTLTGAGTLSSTGLYTAPASISAPSTAIVTARSNADSTKSATANVDLIVTPTAGNGYAYRRTITIDHTRVPNTDQPNFPVLVSGTFLSLATVANGGRVQSPSGFDIVFAADGAGTNALSWEVESYNPTTGAVAFWVKVPLVSHVTDTVFYVFYGRSGIATFQGNRSGTWDSNYASVYHLSDNAANTSVADSSANANHGSAIAPTNAKAVAGRVQGALAFNGATDSVTAANTSSLAITGNLTIEAWVNVNALPSPGNSAYIAGKGYNGSNEGYFLRLVTNNSGVSFLQSGTFTFPSSFLAEVPVSGFAGQWRHVAGSFNGTWSVYVDGVRTGSTQSVSPFFTGEPFVLGARGATGARVAFLNGAIDEVRVSNIARSPDWIAASFNNQNNSAAFAVVGSEQSSGAPSIDVSVAPLAVTLSANQTQQFTPTVTGTANTNVTWTLTGAGTLSTAGLYTAPTSIASPLTATVTATSVADSTKTASALVTLSPPIAVSVTPPAVTLSANQTQQFTPTVTGTANANVTWTLAGAGTLSATGLYTAPASITSTTTVNVTATSIADPTKFATASVTLSPAVAVSVAPPAVTLTANQTQQFTPTVTGSANTNVTWTLTGAGTLSTAGLYTAPVSITSTTTVNVTATSAADPTKSATAIVTLSPGVAVAVAPLTATLSAGQTQQFTPTVTGSANTNVTWTLTGAGTLSTAGLYTAPATIASPVTATVTATSVADPAKSAAASVSLTPTSSSFVNGYSYRRALTIDPTRIPNTDQSNFPVLISGTFPSLASVANGGRVQSPNGFDIVFAADSAGASPLNWEVESYNPTTGAVTFWVNVPLVSHTTGTVLYMFYGKSGVSGFQGNRNGTWDSNFAAVYHHSDNAPNTTVLDSSANANNGTALSPTNAKSVSGRIQGALAYNGTDFVSANSSSLAITGNITIEAWVNVNGLPGIHNNAYIAGKGYNGSNEGYFLRLETNGSGNTFLQAGTYAFPNPYIAQVQISGFAGQWRHVVGSFNGTWSVYVDGVRTGSSQTLGPLNTSEPFLLGARGATGARVSFLNGNIDEVRVSNIARSPDWIAASFNNQSNPASFVSLGAEQAAP